MQPPPLPNKNGGGGNYIRISVQQNHVKTLQKKSLLLFCVPYLECEVYNTNHHSICLMNTQSQKQTHTQQALKPIGYDNGLL